MRKKNNILYVIAIILIIIIIINILIEKRSQDDNFALNKTSKNEKITMQFDESRLPKICYESSKFERLDISAQVIRDVLFQNSEKLKEEHIYYKEGERYLVSDEEERILDYSNKYLMYSTRNYRRIGYFLIDCTNNSLNDSSRFNQKIDLSFASKDKVYRRICDFLNSIGISTENLYYDYFAFDYKTLKDIENDFKSSENEETIESEEYYFFTFRKILHSYPLINLYMDKYTELTPCTSQIQVLCSKNGIDYLYIDTKKEPQVLKSVDDIKKKVVYKYNQLLNSAFYEVDNIEFAYFILEEKKETQLIPVWILSINEKKDNIVNTYQEMYNALTAEEIVL